MTGRPPRSPPFPYPPLSRSSSGPVSAPPPHRVGHHQRPGSRESRGAPHPRDRGAPGAVCPDGVPPQDVGRAARSEEHTSELQSRPHLVCRLLLEKKNKTQST